MHFQLQFIDGRYIILSLFQALNGFLMILDCNGELFFSTHTIETYLGFHQSDVIHQSVYELVHSEDREELQRQLGWNSFMGQEDQNLSLQELLSPEHNHLLDRSFTVRFRCLLDNTSGFLVKNSFLVHNISRMNNYCLIITPIKYFSNYRGSISEERLKPFTAKTKRQRMDL